MLSQRIFTKSCIIVFKRSMYIVYMYIVHRAGLYEFNFVDERGILVNVLLIINSNYVNVSMRPNETFETKVFFFF